MARNDSTRTKQLSANLRSALVTAALVGTLGGWVAFGSQQAATTAADTMAAVAVAQVADTSAASDTSAVAQTTTQSQPSASSQAASSISPVTTTRSSR